MVFNVTIVIQMTNLMNKWTTIVMDDGRVHPLAKSLPSLVSNLWWDVVVDDWNLDEEAFGYWQYLKHCESIIPQNFTRNDKKMLGYRFSVGDTITLFAISIEQDD